MRLWLLAVVAVGFAGAVAAEIHANQTAHEAAEAQAAAIARSLATWPLRDADTASPLLLVTTDETNEPTIHDRARFGATLDAIAAARAAVRRSPPVPAAAPTPALDELRPTPSLHLTTLEQR